MKTISKVFILIFATMVILMNFTINNVSMGDISLKNLEGMQASAAEAWCEETTQNECVIELPNGPTMRGVGQPHAIWP